MVYSPTMYLVAAAVAAVALQMQQTAATSLYYDPIAILPTNESKHSLFSGIAVDEEICIFESHPDPTLPDLAAIPSVEVLYPHLLSNQSTPSDPICLKVGVNVVLRDLTNDLDKYAYVASGSVPDSVTQDSSTVPATKTKTDTKAPTDCVTGWAKPMSPLISDYERNKMIPAKRRLEELTSEHITRLEYFFGVEFELVLVNLPSTGDVTIIPWPSSYWPACEDGLNVQLFQNELPASAKYALAFGLNVKDFMDEVSRDIGIDMERPDKKNKTVCASQDTCDQLRVDHACGIRIGHDSGYCTAKWWGICNAWSSAAILELEPQCPVTYNNVTFHPIELKGLLSYLYNEAMVGYVFTGVRFNGDDDTDAKDEYGRSKSLAFRDLNPGFFHIAMTNIIGLLHQSFIVDVAPGNQVWNQPVRGFKVLELTSMSLKQAAIAFYHRETYPWNANAKSIVYAKTRLTWISETYQDGPLVSTGLVDQFTQGANLTYLLEMDDYGRIIGGEWLFDSLNDHPDFMWFPTGKPAADLVLPNGLSYPALKILLERSVACSDYAQ